MKMAISRQNPIRRKASNKIADKKTVDDWKVIHRFTIYIGLEHF
ncbi:hypothetical protein ACFPFV_06215 [Salinicoccus siamensis]